VSGATSATNGANSGVVSAVFPTTPNQVINTAAISGVTAPVRGATPVTSVSGTGYTGTVTWSPSVSGTFAGGVTYTATLTLTPTTGYSLTGVAANFFTVSGATATNSANTGLVSAVFPATASDPGFYTVNGVTSTPPSTINGGFVTYAQAVSYCSSLTTQGKSWRLPTFAELLALHNALPNAVGGQTPPGWAFISQTWSSTSAGGDSFKTIRITESNTSLNDSRRNNGADNGIALCVTTQ